MNQIQRFAMAVSQVIGVLLALGVQPASAQSYELLTSASPARTSPGALDGVSVSGDIYVFASPETDIDRVTYWVDDVTMAGSPHQVENLPPYDLSGGQRAAANPFDANALGAGGHTITALVELVGGGSEVTTASFSVSSGGGFDLRLSSAPNRSNAGPLEGAQVSGDVYVFTSPETDIDRVTYWVNDVTMAGTPHQVENLPPYDLNGGQRAAANPFDASALGAGEHTITALVELVSGGSEVITASFSVSGGGGFDLRLSSAPNRSNAGPLEGAQVSGDIYVFAVPAASIDRVTYWVDDTSMSGPPAQVENFAPFDLNGGSSSAANPLDTSQLGVGTHTVTALLEPLSGSSQVITATFTVEGGPNQPPVALADSYGTPQDTLLRIPVGSGVLQNDSDPEGDVLDASPVAGPASGVLILAADGSFTYSPDAGFTGIDTFDYEVIDGAGGFAQATVSVQVSAPDGPPRKVILFIADGLGFEQVDAARAFANGDTAPLSFELFPIAGQVATANISGEITDSAAAATAMATGRKVSNKVISVAEPGDGTELTTALEIRAAAGRRTGLVTTQTKITDATPAAFGAHEFNRFDESEIADDYFNQTRPNVLFGLTGPGITPAAATSAGYTVVTNESQMHSLDPTVTAFASGQFSSATIPTLSSMTTAALDLLDDDPDGFLLVIEHEGTDNFGHTNHLGQVIASVLELRDAVDAALVWAAGQTDTLIIVTSDHETGGLMVTENDPVAGVVPRHIYTSIEHTLQDVPLYSSGPEANRLAGLLDNTEIFPVLSGRGEGGTTAFQDGVEPTAGYAGTRDAALLEDVPNTPFGSDTALFVDGDDPPRSARDALALLRWDVSTISFGAIVESAEITIEVTDTSQGSYGIYELLAPWIESAVTWNQAGAGTQWEVPGAQGAQDRGATLLGSVDASRSGSQTFVLNADGVAVVQGWIDDATSNHGLVIADPSTTDGLDFASREDGAPRDRPRLTVVLVRTLARHRRRRLSPTHAPMLGRRVRGAALRDGVLHENADCK